MNVRRQKKLIHEGDYAAEVEVEILDSEDGWAPYLSLTDAAKLDEVRRSLQSGDVKAAGRLARVFQLMPIG